MYLPHKRVLQTKYWAKKNWKIMQISKIYKENLVLRKKRNFANKNKNQAVQKIIIIIIIVI